MISTNCIKLTIAILLMISQGCAVTERMDISIVDEPFIAAEIERKPLQKEVNDEKPGQAIVLKVSSGSIRSSIFKMSKTHGANFVFLEEGDSEVSALDNVYPIPACADWNIADEYVVEAGSMHEAFRSLLKPFSWVPIYFSVNKVYVIGSLNRYSSSFCKDV